MIITTSDFGQGARIEASDPEKVPITLVNGEQLLNLLMRNQIGVTQQRLTAFSLDEESLAAFEESDVTARDEAGVASEYPHLPSRPPLISRGTKTLAMWPLPGGGDAWKNTLDEMLRYVAANAPTVEQAVNWMISVFDRVSSPKSARGYWHVARSFGLLTTVGENLTLTPTGSTYLV